MCIQVKDGIQKNAICSLRTRETSWGPKRDLESGYKYLSSVLNTLSKNRNLINIYTSKRDGEHPHRFHMGERDRVGCVPDEILEKIYI